MCGVGCGVCGVGCVGCVVWGAGCVVCCLLHVSAYKSLVQVTINNDNTCTVKS